MKARIAITGLILLLSGPFAHAQRAGDGTWRNPPVSPSLTPRQAHASAEALGTVYFFGGGTGIGVPEWRHSIEAVVPLYSSLTLLPPIPQPPGQVLAYRYASGCYFGGAVYQIGGEKGVGSEGGTIAWTSTNDVWKYDPNGGVWSQISSMPYAQYEGSAVATEDRIFYIGGNQGATCVLDPTLAGGMGVWTPMFTLSLLPPQRGHFAGYVGGRVVVAGGSTGGPRSANATDAVRIFNPADLIPVWTTGQPMPGAKHHGCTFVANDRLYAVGGFPSAQGASCFEYNIAVNQWTVRSPMIAGDSQMAGGVLTSEGVAYGVVLGGYNSPYNFREYRIPDFGNAPDDPTAISCRKPGGPDLSEGDWINGTEIVIAATASDPDEDEIRIESEIRPGIEPFTGVPNAFGPWIPEDAGPTTITASFTGLGEGPYRFRVRVRDWNDNLNPSGWMSFGSDAADFQVDQTPPTGTEALSPASDLLTPPVDPTGMTVRFEWTAATDDGPGSPTYEVQVALDEDFQAIVTTQGGVGALFLETRIGVSRFPYVWRVRAVDVAGNPGPWSDPLEFRVISDDGIRRSAGDAQRVCGFSSAPGGSLSALGGLLLLVLLAHRLR